MDLLRLEGKTILDPVKSGEKLRMSDEVDVPSTEFLKEIQPAWLKVECRVLPAEQGVYSVVETGGDQAEALLVGRTGYLSKR